MPDALSSLRIRRLPMTAQELCELVKSGGPGVALLAVPGTAEITSVAVAPDDIGSDGTTTDRNLAEVIALVRALSSATPI